MSTIRTRLLAAAVAATAAAALTSCTIATGPAPEDSDTAPDTDAAAPAPAPVTETVTQASPAPTTLTETETVAETTLTTTATRWAIGDPAQATHPNQQLFGPYPDQEHCERLARTACVERDDGWYLELEDPEPAEESESDSAPAGD